MSSLLLLIGAVCLAGIVVAVGFLALTNDDAPARRKVRPPTVIINETATTVEVKDNDYTPPNITVQPGTTVTWTFVGSLPHSVTDPAGAFDSEVLKKGDTFEMTFDTPGQYSYYCILHHAMQGTLIVAAAATS